MQVTTRGGQGGAGEQVAVVRSGGPLPPSYYVRREQETGRSVSLQEGTAGVPQVSRQNVSFPLVV